MKKTSRPQPKDAPPKSGGGMMIGIFVGLVIGVLIAFAVVLFLNRTPLPFMNKYEGANNGNGKAQPGTTTAAPQPIPLPGKPGDKPVEKPRFDFYGILEGKQPAGAGAAPGTAPAPSAPPVATPEAKSGDVYYLQAGAFQKTADADNLKAKLALLGVDATVQETNVAGKGNLFRVRTGPFKSPDEMNRVRTQMAEGGVQATVVKLKE